jgi:hypothetical protein
MLISRCSNVRPEFFHEGLFSCRKSCHKNWVLPEELTALLARGQVRLGECRAFALWAQVEMRLAVFPKVSGIVTANAIMQPHDIRKWPQNRRGPRWRMKR